MKKSRKIVSVFLLGALISNLIPTYAGAQSAPSASNSVIINEIAWAGTVASTSDEWIELYNNSDQPVDLSGWRIEDDDGAQQYTISNGTISARSYFLIEDSQETTSVNADAIANLSLSNAGDKLVLKDASGNIVNTVNGSSSSWYAGNADTKAAMERTNTNNTNDIATNWTTNTLGSGALDRSGNAIIGTPRGQNSSQMQRSFATLTASNTRPRNGDNVIVETRVQNVQNLFSYGFDIIYNPSILEFNNTTKGGFLSENENVSTSFQSGLENGTSGKLVVAEARLNSGTATVSGSGLLFSMRFRVTGSEGSNTNISIGTSSFLAGTSGDLVSSFSGAPISVEITVAEPVQNLRTAEHTNRYQIAITWQAPEAGADSYRILRKNTSGAFVEIGTTTTLSFIDANHIIPNKLYEYQIIAVKNSRSSTPSEISQRDSRGLKGDTNRSDRVDGRDLERLARHFAEMSSTASFDALIDTTYDGRIDGSDLIDLAANWALTYNA